MTQPRPAAKQTCEQCGRTGTRFFETLTADGRPPLTICKAKAACRLRQPKPVLTPRQLEVLRLAANGMSNASIGRETRVPCQSVVKLLCAVYRKLGARDRAHAVALAFTAGIITAADIRQPGEDRPPDAPRHGPQTARRTPRTRSAPLAPHETATTPHTGAQPANAEQDTHR